MVGHKRIAVFIDAENLAAEHAEEIFAYCVSFSRHVTAWCYGRQPALNNWEPATAKHHITPVLTKPWASKNNAADFALVIDAVAHLVQSGCEHVVIASSDADFEQLAVFIGQRGSCAHGIGDERAPATYRKAFAHFHVLKKPKTETPAGGTLSGALALTQPVDKDFLLKVFSVAAGGAPELDFQAFARALANTRKNYSRGHGTARKYISKSDEFVLLDKSVRLKSHTSLPGKSA